MRAQTKHEELHQEASETGQPYDLADAPSQPDLQEQIRQRAYELSQQRGDGGGDELDDWYRAEAEIRAAFGPSEFTETENEDEGKGRYVASAR
ncbi:MAG: DUF2934 domain-containing protein [Blastocatellia bacterium]